MTKQFTKFPSLENTYRQKEIDKILMMDIKDQWVVTEKVHGANFSFWVYKNVETKEIDIKCAKRSGWIEEDEKFFNYKSVLEKYRPMLEKLRGDVLDNFVIYGELFGGNIQSGMCYSLEQDFVAFDMRWINEDGSLGLPLDKLTMLTLKDDYNLPVTPLIGVYDTFEEALAVEESFTSKLIRQDFDGKEEHKETEGIVIEPNNAVYEPNGSRVYLKKKTKRFLEKGGKPNIKHKVPMLLQESVQLKLDEALLFLNNNRFDSVVSKIGEVSIKDIGKVMGLLTQDIVVDMEKDLEQSVDLWFETKGEKQLFMKNSQKVVQDFVKPILLSM